MHRTLNFNGPNEYAKTRPATVVSITHMIHLLIRVALDPMVKLLFCITQLNLSS